MKATWLLMALSCLAIGLGASGCAPAEGGGGGGGGGSGGSGGESDAGMGGEGEGEGEGENGCQAEPPTEDDPEVLDSCDGRDICICAEGHTCPGGGGTCEPAFNRRYELLVAAAVFPERKLNGDCWDGGCGAPDIYVDAYLDDEYIGSTFTAQDSFTGQWSEADASFGRVTIINGSVLRLISYDEDLTADDIGLDCVLDIDAEFLRRRVIICADAEQTFGIVGVLRP